MSELIISALGLGALYLISNQKENTCETLENRNIDIKKEALAPLFKPQKKFKLYKWCT